MNEQGNKKIAIVLCSLGGHIPKGAAIAERLSIAHGIHDKKGMVVLSVNSDDHFKDAMDKLSEVARECSVSMAELAAAITQLTSAAKLEEIRNFPFYMQNLPKLQVEGKKENKLKPWMKFTPNPSSVIKRR